ncbi:alpha/beta fold hydrolase, partial [Streptomyces gardneri]|uniref:alpha/beta fold hydrolase n=1 Tax=Streptomyces gardneri TaxID=66892 RepID=UPI003699B387
QTPPRGQVEPGARPPGWGGPGGGGPRGARPPAVLGGYGGGRGRRPGTAQLAGAGRLLLGDPDGTAELLELRMPLHIAYGADEMVWPPAELAAAAARVGAHHTVVEGAGHSPNVSHPGELTDRLTGFWERVAALTEAGAAAP